MKQGFPSYEEYKDYLLKHSVTTKRAPLVGSDVIPYLVVLWGFMLLGYMGLVFLEEHGFDPLWDWFGMDSMDLFGIVFVGFVLLFIGGVIISFLQTSDTQTDQQHDHNLKTLARLFNLTLDEQPCCEINVLAKALHPYWFSDYSIEVLGSLYGKIQNRLGEIVFLQKIEKTTNEQNEIKRIFMGYGLLAIFPLKTHFSSTTILCHDKERIWPKYMNKWQKANLESADFEKLFDVFTTSQIESRQLLAPDTIEIITQNFKDISLSHFAISFSHNYLFVLIPHADEWTSPLFYKQLSFLFHIPALFNFKNFPYEWDTDSLYRQRFQQDKQNDW